MLSRIAAAIGRFFRSLGSDIWSSRWDIVNWCETVAKAPFRLVFGHAAPPSYTPDIPASNYVDILKDARAAAVVKERTFDRSVIESVLEYCRAHADSRATMRLPKQLNPKVQATLLTMDDAALRALSRAGMSQVKRFVEGIPHGISDVPGYGEFRPTAANDQPPRNLTAHERILWKVRAGLEKEKEAEPFTNPRVVSF